MPSSTRRVVWRAMRSSHASALIYGLTFAATTEEITRRADAGQGYTDPKTFREYFVCDREKTQTLELIIDVRPKP